MSYSLVEAGLQPISAARYLFSDHDPDQFQLEDSALATMILIEFKKTATAPNKWWETFSA